jgi:hypothetical protein
VVSSPSESLTTILEGTANFDPAAVCTADSTQSVSPAPVGPNAVVPEFPLSPALSVGTIAATAGMVALGRHYRKIKAADKQGVAGTDSDFGSTGLVNETGLAPEPAEAVTSYNQDLTKGLRNPR